MGFNEAEEKLREEIKCLYLKESEKKMEELFKTNIERELLEKHSESL